MKELDLLKILKTILHHIVPILISGVVVAVACFSYSTFFLKTTYMTSAQILVDNGGLNEAGPSNSGTVEGADLSTSLNIVNTCVDILKSDNLYKDLAKALNDKYSYYSLKSAFSIAEHDERSLCIDIAVSGTDPQLIKTLANTFLDIAPTYLSTKIRNTQVSVLATADKVVRTGPQIGGNTAIGFVAGALLCAAVFVIISLARNIIENEKDFKDNYDIPLLGVVPLFENPQGGKRNGSAKQK